MLTILTISSILLPLMGVIIIFIILFTLAIAYFWKIKGFLLEVFADPKRIEEEMSSTNNKPVGKRYDELIKTISGYGIRCSSAREECITRINWWITCAFLIRRVTVLLLIILMLTTHTMTLIERLWGQQC